ncbi:ribosome-associated translation inhibitor RaiA [bacterium]|nr:ribosome-associated translation inhibitor RaiA [bacterium]
MQVAITCRHGHLHAETRDHVAQKAEKLLTYFERIAAIQVTFDFSNGQAMAEILVDAEHKHNFVATETAAEAGVAFDAALVKMEHQLKKYKEKIQDHRRDPSLGELGAEAAESSAS